MTERRARYTAGSDANEAMERWLDTLGAPAYAREFMFAKPKRKWRADFCWPELRLIVEVDGGLYIPGGGGHNRAAGRKKDMERDNWCAMHGWRVLRYTAAQARDGSAADEVVRFIEANPNKEAK